MDTLQAVAEPRRRAILRLIWEQERSAGDIAANFDISFPAVSQHLRVLRDVGVVEVRKDGNKRFYRALPDQLGAMREALEQMWALDLQRLAVLAEREAEDASHQEDAHDAG